MNLYDIAEKYENLKKRLKKHYELQITDNKEIIIDGCREVIVYDDNYIKLQLNCGGVEIFGMNFSMRNFSDDGVVIKGIIFSINLLREGDIK